MKKIESGQGLEDDNDELTKLVQENTKLKHRLAVLNRVNKFYNLKKIKKNSNCFFFRQLKLKKDHQNQLMK